MQPTAPPPATDAAAREADALARLMAGGNVDVFEAMRALVAEWPAEAAE